MTKRQEEQGKTVVVEEYTTGQNVVIYKFVTFVILLSKLKQWKFNFIKKKTVAIDQSLTEKKCHNIRIWHIL